MELAAVAGSIFYICFKKANGEIEKPVKILGNGEAGQILKKAQLNGEWKPVKNKKKILGIPVPKDVKFWTALEQNQ